MMGIWSMKDHIQIRKATITEYIANCPVYELCTGAEQIPGLIRFMYWWVQDINQEVEGNGAREVGEREVV